MVAPETHHEQREKEKNNAIDQLEEAIVLIEGEQRSPNVSEQALLLSGINCVFNGLYSCAVMHAYHAATTELSPSVTAKLPPQYSECTIAMMKEELRQARLRNAEPFPIFFGRRG